MLDQAQPSPFLLKLAVLHIHDAMDRPQVPTEQEFDKLPQASNALEEPLKWRELSNGIYGIIDVRHLTTKYGDAAIAKLYDQDDASFSAWLPKSVIKLITPASRFIRYKGTKKLKDGKFMYDVSVV